ncbi:hypothetical protein EYF80_032734 [Liparis tanakae]|uniref:Uncharacterized protein n=1 Tax=Liparis tanakae TaxID=230148 RepID=A0A4Z2GUG2_9TELE|nr:hypothetical protein EYF80_032734 [Liparis tanakae]
MSFCVDKTNNTPKQQQRAPELCAAEPDEVDNKTMIVNGESKSKELISLPTPDLSSNSSSGSTGPDTRVL